ncbi:hypothetical protein OsJ_23308 [Oryza sativa Japonica Group]|jgi:hypothetical protein|uniref:Uncharacterized protein n=1 Tax=Oryza sativa subsp. japonica TaxID=39947 RepID=A3BH50_ORYSJ|nr:hypothetical protein OsJ_23308 [Oryza sativa Japonica Group]
MSRRKLRSDEWWRITRGRAGTGGAMGITSHWVVAEDIVADRSEREQYTRMCKNLSNNTSKL